MTHEEREPIVNPYKRVGAVWCQTCGYFTLPLDDGKCGFCNSWLILKPADETCRMDSDAITEEVSTTA